MYQRVALRTRAHGRSSKRPPWHRMVLCLVVLLGCRVIGCGAIAAQTRVDEAGRTIQHDLYTPRDAVLLGEAQSSEFLAYGRSCTGTHIELVYGTNRSIEEIVAEYKEQMLNRGWIPHPGYDIRGAKDHFYFQRGPEAMLGISNSPVLVPLDKSETEPFATIYVVYINYVEPSYPDCVG